MHRSGLRAGPAAVETAWDQLPVIFVRWVASGNVRLDDLDEAAAAKSHRQARARWSDVGAHPALAPSP